MRFTTILLILGLGAASLSCVSARKFQESEAQRIRLQEEKADLAMQVEIADESITLLSRAHAILRQDTTRLGLLKRELQGNLFQTTEANQQLQLQIDRLAAGHAEELQLALSRMNAIQDNLQGREDEVRRQEEQLAALMSSFTAKGTRVEELEGILRKQEEVVQQLRQTVAQALLGFEGRGLTINIRQGKVYVSLDESLLFASGSATVDRAGQAALVELAKVLAANPDITVMIEGHTDDVPLRAGGPIRDNWDLSVLRATSIIRILQREGNINPARFIAAGRAEFLPLDPARTPEARRRNRRTEIILTPNLDPLFQIIETR
ncbi:MAG TPA: hypothetical protein DCM62_04420 [Bacteroidales bacterium]|nr:hypothetical protein [Bacteroidales bacterium]